jgi:putative acetyltransferase
MNMESTISRAKVEDAEQICSVIRRSICEICVKDYPEQRMIDEWCKNKTPENITLWLKDPENYFIVSFDASHKMEGVGLYRESLATILLLYVLPESLGKGVGGALLRALEERAAALSHTRIELESTITSEKFYERHGYKCSGDALMSFGLVEARPMSKIL